MAHIVVTISQPVGSGGVEVGQGVAQRLGIAFLDREIISRAAAQAGVSEETIQEAERVPSFLSRMVELLGRYPVAAELIGPTGDLPPAPALTTESYRFLIEDVLRSVAERGDVVILGHGAQAVLKDIRHLLRVLVCAPLHARVARLMSEDNIDRATAEREIKESDRQRSEYFQNYYKVHWLDPTLYDLSINTDRLTIGDAIDLVVAAAKKSQE